MRDSITNGDLTTDGNVSYTIINDLHGIIKYFGMSSHTPTNLPNKNDREFKCDPHLKDVQKLTQMINVTASCMITLCKSICPGLSCSRLMNDTIIKLRKSLYINDDGKNYKRIFEHVMEQMYCIMINANQGSTKKGL